jgi:hypothetical protein
MSVFLVRVRDERFELTDTQIEIDSPNFFPAAFSGDWQEEPGGALVLRKQHPDYFALIVEYLSGYRLFPLDGPAELHRKRLANLKVDAQFLQLDGLLRCIEEEGVDGIEAWLRADQIAEHRLDGLAQHAREEGASVHTFAIKLTIRQNGNSRGRRHARRQLLPMRHCA